MSTAQSSSGVGVTGTIVRKDPNDTYPTHKASLGKGGYFEVDDIAARDNIPSEQRTLGMHVYCVAENETYILKIALDNASWVLDQSAGVTDHYALTHIGVNTHDQIDEFISSKGNANGLVPLGADTKIPTQYIPALAILDVVYAASEAEMLAASVQKGDLCIRNDEAKTYILKTDDPTQLINWALLLFPGSVVSVNGKTGVVALSLTDLIDASIVSPVNRNCIVYNSTTGLFENRMVTMDDITDLVTTLSAKAPSIHTHTVSQITDYITDITSRLLAYAPISHTQAISTITDLQNQLNTINTNLAGKAPIVHTHVIANVTGLQTALDGVTKGLGIATAANISSITTSMVRLGTILYIEDETKYYKCLDNATPNVITAWQQIDGTSFDSFELFTTDTPTIQGQHRDRLFELDILTNLATRSIPITLKFPINILTNGDVILIPISQTPMKFMITDIYYVYTTISGVTVTNPAYIKIGNNASKDNILGSTNLHVDNIANSLALFTKLIPSTNYIIDLTSANVVMNITPPVSGWTIGAIELFLQGIIL